MYKKIRTSIEVRTWLLCADMLFANPSRQLFMWPPLHAAFQDKQTFFRDSLFLQIVVGVFGAAFLGNAFEAIKACGINGKVTVVRDIQTILKYGITSTPALVINGVVMFAGTMPSVEEIVKLLQQNHSTFT